MKKVLLIEDEKNLSRFIELELQYEGYEVSVAYDGKTGLYMATAQEWDVILLDLMLPGMDGIELCRRTRLLRQTPIIMLTARDSISDRVAGLNCGADDYMPKPFAIEELLARIHVIFRRQEAQHVNRASELVYLDLTLNLDSRELMRGEELIELTKREYELLVAFMENQGRVLSRELLLDKVWGVETAVDTNVVDVYVRYLRNKIDVFKEESYIKTQRGIGYVMSR